MTRWLRRRFLWAVRRYLRWAGGATRNGSDDGGYIVAMTADQYHRYTVLARDVSAKEFHAIVWASRDAGVNVP